MSLPPISTTIIVKDEASKAFSSMTKSITSASEKFDSFHSKISNNKSFFVLSNNIQKEVLKTKKSISFGGVFGRLSETGKGTINRISNAFKHLQTRMHQTQNEASKTRLSLASIGQAYWGIMGIAQGFSQFTGIFTEADKLSRLTARINLLNETQKRGSTTQQIDASFGATANELGMDKGQFAEGSLALLTGTGGAFNNIKEAAKFNELLLKQFAASGVSAEAAASATEQLRQGLSKGALQGEDLKSILSSSPQLVDLFAQKMGVAAGQVRQAASEGKLTADVIKGALFENADTINEQFSKMPATWDRVMTNLKNRFMDNMQPILEAISSFAASEMFNTLSDSLLGISKIFVGLAKIIATALKPIVPIFSSILKGINFMIDAIQNNIKLFGLMAGAMLGVAIAFKVITGWQQIMITLQKIMTATNPFLLIGVAIIGAVMALKHLYDTDLDFQFSVKKGWESIKYMLAMGLSYLQQGFSFFIGAIIEEIGRLLLTVQNVINNAMQLYSKFRGIDYENLTFASDMIHKGIKMGQSWSYIKERSMLSNEHMMKLASLEDEKQEAIRLAAEKAKKEEENEPLELAYGSSPSKPLHTKGTTKIDKDSIQLLKDIASVEIVNRYTTVRPRINAKFGDIHQTTDVDQLLTYLENDFSSKVESSLSPVGA